MPPEVRPDRNDAWVVIRLDVNDGGTVSVREKSLKDHQIGLCSQPLINMPHNVPQVLTAQSCSFR